MEKGAVIYMIFDNVSEQALIASVLRKPSEFPILDALIRPDDFHWQCFKWCWDAFKRLSEKSLTIDVITLGDELKRDNLLESFKLPDSQFMGRNAISKIKEIPTSETGVAYAMTVQDYSAKRKIMQSLTEGAKWCQNGRSASSIVSDVVGSLNNVVVSSGGKEYIWETDRASEAALKATEIAKIGGNEVTTGLTDLDTLLAPQKTDLIVVGARPGQGKSALCGTITLANALNRKTMLFTIEMGAVQVTQRLIAQIGNLSAFQIMRGKLSDQQHERYVEAANTYNELKPNLLTIDKAAIRLSQIRLEARKWKPEVIIIDYIQLAEADKKNERRDLDIGEITRGLKALAKETNACVFAAAQLGRDAQDREPTLADLRESGAIENDADSVVFIYHYDKVKFSQTSLQVAKHRNGPVGKVTAYFDEEPVAFRNAAKEYSWTERKDIAD